MSKKDTPFVLERLDDTPLSERVRRALLDAIMEKRFEGRLPPEDVLAEMLNVSRTTIRSALQSLEEQGIVNRKRAVGTTINSHIRPSALALQRLVGFDSLLREKGSHIKVQIEWEHTVPPPEVLSVFAVEPDRECLVTLKSYLADDRAAMVIRDMVPWDTLLDQEFDEPVPASLFDFTRRHCKTPIDHAVVEVAALAPSPEVETMLAVPKGKAFMRLHETHYSKAGDALAFSVIDVDNEFVTFEVLRRG